MGKPKTNARKAAQVLLGNSLKKAREQKGFSQGQVAMRLGIQQSSVSKYEKGLTEPGAIVLGKMAAMYGVTLESLLQPASQQALVCSKQDRTHRPGYRKWTQAAKAASKSALHKNSAGVNRAEGIRLFKLAGRPTKEQFILVYGERGPKMTWDQRAAAGVPAAKFQAALASAVRGQK